MPNPVGTETDEQAKRLAIIQRVVWRETVQPVLAQVNIENVEPAMQKVDWLHPDTPPSARFVSDLLVSTLMGTPGYSSTIIALCEQEEGFSGHGD